MKDKKQIIISIVTVVIVIVIVSLFAVLTSKSNTPRPGYYEGGMSLEKIAELSSCPLTSDKDVFAQCLTEKGWAMYGAVWCSHCKEQKDLFGESFKFVKYIECPDNIQLCTDKKVVGYPTWIVEK